MGRNWKKKRSTRVGDIRKQLSKSEKKHLYEFGELHPAVEEKLKGKTNKLPDKARISSLKKSTNQHGTSIDELTSTVKRPSVQKLTYAQDLVSNTSSDSEDNDKYRKLISSLDSRHDLKRKRHSNKIRKPTKKKNKEDIQQQFYGDDDAADKHTATTMSPTYSDTSAENNNDSDDLNEEEAELSEDDEPGDSVVNINESDTDEDSTPTLTEDPFKVHFDQQLTSDDIDRLKNGSQNNLQQSFKDEWLDDVTYYPTPVSISTISLPTSGVSDSLQQLHVKQRLINQWNTVNKKCVSPSRVFSPLQERLFNLLSTYRDVLYTKRAFNNADQIRNIYCLHALNHVLKIRHSVLKNNSKIIQAQKENREVAELRDQGFTRPKVLIVVPFRESARKVVETCNHLLLAPDEGQINYKKRFQSEYAGDEEKRNVVRPDDYWQLFAGNTDDHFRIGINITRKVIKLYAPFYNSDIIVASPLGLRTIIGADGDKNRDYDFLSSIDIVIVDQVDVLLMQNWDHVSHLFKHLNLQPAESHDTDFSRVRMWTLDGCVVDSVDGSICQVGLRVPQILPQYRTDQCRTLIFVPSYFDFVRIRNCLKKEEIKFDCISESTNSSRISRIRAYFTDNKISILLYTERFHFFRRYKIRGIRHVIFYGLPMYAVFYPEIINMIETDSSQLKSASIPGTTCTVLYTKYDIYQLNRIVGTERCRQLLTSSKKTHLFTN
ncbi:uncharacterized protein TRIADDRAFT_57324 [Trichoplax adhaerens]|uniref:U3 small nucleolar RNA-associated protein 25 homolog n=1 Tax=Trichoplax adhaerens TaxID=10228 RepID=B3RZ47_TRIAD|nr:hypothetical protein TRIADDRAFT_57324 [Trichoplax adhaerens]EDV23779.1 hypothetical protein TRIADDRAFT_57324 [Trichoplax adhaerens]|eukprot:XP_002113305.1 hypothetical protein TRIADDRAFT_57324 [Trichoplax adhaerens]